MLEISKNTKVGFGLTAIGMGFIIMSILLSLEVGLLAIGNFMLLSGLSFSVGFKRTFSFFFQWERIKGTLSLSTGIIILFRGHPILGIGVELAGFYFILESFLPKAKSYISQSVPFFGTVRNISIV